EDRSDRARRVETDEGEADACGPPFDHARELRTVQVEDGCEPRQAEVEVEHRVVGKGDLRVPLPVEVSDEAWLPVVPPILDFVGRRRDLSDRFAVRKLG